LDASAQLLSFFVFFEFCSILLTKDIPTQEIDFFSLVVVVDRYLFPLNASAIIGIVPPANDQQFGKAGLLLCPLSFLRCFLRGGVLTLYAVSFSSS